MSLRNLRKGENTTIPEEVRRIQLVLTWNDQLGDREVDASALLLDSRRRVRSDADFIFYNQPTSSDDAICHLGKTNTEAGLEERVAVDLDAISDEVTSVVFSASVDKGSFGALNPLRLIVIDSTGTSIAQYDINDATVETAIILGEVYRRSGGWKLRAVGQGWSTGLAGLASDFGVNVDDEEKPEADPVSSTTTTGSVAESSEQETGDRRGSETPTDVHLTECETDACVNVVELVDENMPGSVPAGSLASEQDVSTTTADVSDDGKSPTAPSRKIWTRKPKTITIPPKLTLADDDTWQPARMFSVYGVGSNQGGLAVTEALFDPDSSGGDADREVVEHERAKLWEFSKNLTPYDIKSGEWFTKLIAQALSSYTNKVDWRYFQERYGGIPADAIVDQRIKMAARYAALEGGLSAGAYSAALVATLGSLGGVSPATIPAAVTTMMVDVAFITKLQLRLAYDIAALYRVPLDLSDPHDMWKLIRVAFTVKSGGMLREGIVKTVPTIMRRIIKRFYSGAVLNAAKGFPFVGKFLLQRNVIKIGIPVIGVPLAVVLNRYTTLIAGRHAQAIFRNEARVIELAENLSEQSQHPRLMLWVAWLVITADHKIADDESLLMRHLVKLVRDQHQIVDEQFAHLINIDPNQVWRRLEAESGDLSDILDVANRVAAVDGPVNALEKSIICEIRDHCHLL